MRNVIFFCRKPATERDPSYGAALRTTPWNPGTLQAIHRAAGPPLLGCLFLGFLEEDVDPRTLGFLRVSHPALSRRHAATCVFPVVFPVF